MTLRPRKRPAHQLHDGLRKQEGIEAVLVDEPFRGSSAATRSGNPRTRRRSSRGDLRHSEQEKHRSAQENKSRAVLERPTDQRSPWSPVTEPRYVPATLELSIAALKPGTHTLTVRLAYKRTKHKHGHKITLTVTKTLKVKFKVC